MSCRYVCCYLASQASDRYSESNNSNIIKNTVLHE